MTAAADEVAASFRASEVIFTGMGALLFAEFCRHAADDPEMIALGGLAMAGARPAHLFSAVHYLLLGDPSDPLARHFATLDEAPLAPAGAYPKLARFCAAHRGELVDLLRTRTVQTTYAERCRALLAPMGVVTGAAGEPLNLIEIGCSAGALLVFDKFAYRMDGSGLVGDPGAPVVLEGELRNGPPLFIPTIGKRIGIDLHTIDARSPEDCRWLLALCFPELRDEQRRLAAALEVIAETDITMLEGDGLARLREALALAPDPLCVFHSACLFYWPPEARRALEDLLLETARTREFWRISIEPSDTFDDWQHGRGAGGVPPAKTRKSGEIRVFHYRDGAAACRPVGVPSADYGTIEWIDAC
ncbi:MAG: DUF2332 family protein [Sphingomonadales bacterium]|nr:DUF2332 family protein [Sphingomonadales bacterium]